MKNQENIVVLEPSTNTHKLNATNVVSENLENGIINLCIEGNGIVTHGQHGTVVTESKFVTKFVQQELNPVTKKMQAAFD